jgi:drug/metabolite transporter (DMT)-like permease
MSSALLTPPRAPDRRALAAALVTVALWASAFVGIRAAGPDLSGGALALGRLLIGSAALGLLMLVRRERLPPRAVVPGIALCGVLWFGAYNVALNEAERRVDAGTAAMLVNLGPVFIAVLAGLLLGEGFPRTLLQGGAVALLGATIIALVTGSGRPTAGLGAALCVVAAATYAGGVVAQKPLLARCAPLPLTWLACTIGAVACLPFAPSLTGELADARPGAIAWTVYLGVMPTAVAFTTWAYALSRTTAGRMGATTYLVPPLAIALGWALLSEVPPVGALAGGVLCLAGVVIARRG